MRKFIFSAILLAVMAFTNYSFANKPHNERTAPPREHMIKVLEKFNPHDNMAVQPKTVIYQKEHIDKNTSHQSNHLNKLTGKFIPQEAGDARQPVSKSSEVIETKAGNSSKSMIMQKAHVQARGSCAEEAAACSGKASSGATAAPAKVEKQTSTMKDAIEKKENERIIAALKAMLAKKMHLGEK